MAENGIIASSATKALHETIKQFNKQSEKYIKQMLNLTVVIAILTFVMALLACIQIYLIWHPPDLDPPIIKSIVTSKLLLFAV